MSPEASVASTKNGVGTEFADTAKAAPAPAAKNCLQPHVESIVFFGAAGLASHCSLTITARSRRL